jgi:hypothetical protein
MLLGRRGRQLRAASASGPEDGKTLPRSSVHEGILDSENDGAVANV